MKQYLLVFLVIVVIVFFIIILVYSGICNFLLSKRNITVTKFDLLIINAIFP